VWVYDTYPEPTRGEEGKAFDAYQELAGHIISWSNTTLSRTSEATQRELRTALWALHKAAKVVQPVNEVDWRMGQPWLTDKVDLLLEVINDFGDDALQQERAGLREVINERRSILFGEVGVKRGEGTAVYVADQIHLRRFAGHRL
jgi:hypothetical protein